MSLYRSSLSRMARSASFWAVMSLATRTAPTRWPDSSVSGLEVISITRPGIMPSNSARAILPEVSVSLWRQWAGA